MKRFNPIKLPRTRASMAAIVSIFPTPRPDLKSILLELSAKEKQCGTKRRSPEFPANSFEHQLQSLFDHSVFCDIGNLVVNEHNRWAPYEFVNHSPDEHDYQTQDGLWYQNIVNHEPRRNDEIIIGL